MKEPFGALNVAENKSYLTITPITTKSESRMLTILPYHQISTSERTTKNSCICTRDYVREKKEKKPAIVIQTNARVHPESLLSNESEGKVKLIDTMGSGADKRAREENKSTNQEKQSQKITVTSNFATHCLQA